MDMMLEVKYLTQRTAMQWYPDRFYRLGPPGMETKWHTALRDGKDVAENWWPGVLKALYNEAGDLVGLSGVGTVTITRYDLPEGVKPI